MLIAVGRVVETNGGDTGGETEGGGGEAGREEIKVGMLILHPAGEGLGDSCLQREQGETKDSIRKKRKRRRGDSSEASGENSEPMLKASKQNTKRVSFAQ